MKTMKEERVGKEFFEKELNDGSLFIKEKHLANLPLDWIDCILFIHTQGIDQNPQSYCIIMDDEQSEKFFKLTAKADIKLYVMRDNNESMWQLWLTKEKNKETGEYERLFIGGENLRNFCDSKNIYYKSGFTKDGSLLSGTNLMYLKDEGEDCRIPLNKDDKNGISETD